MRVNSNRGAQQSLYAKLEKWPAVARHWNVFLKPRHSGPHLTKIAVLILDNGDAIHAEAMEAKTRSATAGLAALLARVDAELSQLQELYATTISNSTKSSISSTQERLRAESKKLPEPRLLARRGRPGKPVKKRIQERLQTLGLTEYSSRLLLSVFEAHP